MQNSAGMEHSPSRAMELEPLRARFLAFTAWGTLVGIAFFSVYPATNWLAEGRETYTLYFQDELRIPFIPGFVWLYLSLYGLFLLPPFFLGPRELARLARELIIATVIAGLVFLAAPARLGFLRTLPEEPFYRDLFQTLFAIDRPFNLVPSLHVVYAVAIGMAVTRRTEGLFRRILPVWIALLVLSTLLVHQHHLADVASGTALALGIHLLMEKKA